MFKILKNEWNIPKQIEDNRFVLLEFGTNDCGPCHAIQNKLKEWSEKHEDVQVIYIPVEQYQVQATQMGIMSAPTVVCYIDGQLTQKESGYFSLDRFLDNVERLLSIAK